MMPTLGDLFTALFGTAPDAAWRQPIGPVVIDSRQAGPGSLFVAIRGGHNYLAEAFQAGARAAIISQDVAFEGPLIRANVPDNLAQLTISQKQPFCIQTDDSILGLQKLAAYWRQKFSPNVIGITGSIGKSSTKELAHAVLAQQYRTLKNEGNLNNEIGLPLTLMQLDNSYEQVVLEMGMYDIGEIETLCHIAQPQVGLVTNIGPTHLERLGSIERIAQAKGELVEALPKEGQAILNADDPRVAALAGHTKAQVFTFGLTNKADLWADQITSHGLGGLYFSLHYLDQKAEAHVPLLGRHNVYTALAAAAIGLTQGLDWEKIVAGLQDRQAGLRLTAVPGLNDALILDDTYNASAESSIAALNLLHEVNGRKIAVLGHMAELGAYEEEAHRKVGRRAAEVVDLLLAVGPKAGLITEEAIAYGLPETAGICLNTNQEALEYLQTILRAGDIVLIKGSRSLEMESIVTQLRAAQKAPWAKA